MTKDGIKKCVRVLQLSFPNTYKNFSMEDLQMLMEVWDLQFKNCDDFSVFTALNEAVSTSEYPPTFGEIKKHLLHDVGESDEVVWGTLLKAGRNGLHGAVEEWEKLPEDLRSVTTPGTIREIALSDNESLQFIKRDVMNSYRTQRERKTSALLSGYTDTKLLN